MPALTGLGLVVAGLTALAGAQKLLDPAATVGALRALNLPARPLIVRLGSAAELGLATIVLVQGGLWWWPLAASYVLFAAFVVAALRAGTMIGSCGCFGREDTPPHPTHLALNLVLASISLALAVQRDGAPAAVVADDLASGAALVALAVVVVGLLYATYVELPRALVTER